MNSEQLRQMNQVLDKIISEIEEIIVLLRDGYTIHINLVGDMVLKHNGVKIADIRHKL